MSKGEIEEETYSLVFSSLKHPIRRKILRILVDRSLSFSEILEITTIDSGHLSYHIENLGDLVKHSDGKYRLSSIGQAAVSLMKGVEEQPQQPSVKKPERRSLKIARNTLIVTSLIAIIALAALNVHYGNSLQDISKARINAAQVSAFYFHLSILRATDLSYLKINYRQGLNGIGINEENIEAIIGASFNELDTGVSFLRCLKRLYPELATPDQPLEIVYNFMDYTMTSWEPTSVRTKLGHLVQNATYSGNYTIVLEAFNSLHQILLSDLRLMSDEVLESFYPLNVTRLLNTSNIVEGLQNKLDQWMVTYP